MNKKPRGYAYAIVKANAAADQNLIGVRFGKFCIENDISVTAVAELLRVSRQSVYTWFVGKFQPRADQVLKISNLMAEHEKAQL